MVMRYIQPFLLFLCSSTIVGQISFAQVKYSKFSVNTAMQDSFSFAKEWDYSWEVFKDSNGTFKKNGDAALSAGDTSHLYFTADCHTNVQGGYHIRYCNAERNRHTITLTFSDGLPAYASAFYIFIQADSFAFKPTTVYPGFVPGQHISYQVTKQQLTLHKSKYLAGDLIIGYVDAAFIETVSLPKKAIQQHTFYLRGYIRTSLEGRL